MNVNPIIGWLALALLVTGCATTPPRTPTVQVKQDAEAVQVLTASGQELVRYQLKLPMGSALTVESACYFHPLKTPAGVTVTDVAPLDHRHHRGIFFAWLEVHGQEKAADFWGWGEHAPTKGRRIVSRDIVPSEDGFTAHNEWLADGVVMIDEQMEARVQPGTNVNVLDLVYTLTPRTDLTLSRWAFSGFCVRSPKHPITVSSADGGTFPPPNHMQPDTDWPDQAWYAFSFDLPKDGQAGVALFNHPDNPPTRWHNVASIAMLNPCVVALDELTLKSNQPIVFRYRVAAFDGPAHHRTLTRLEEQFLAK